MKNISYLIIIVILASVVVAQPRSDRPQRKSIMTINASSPQMQGGNRGGERMEMMLTWKLTKDLDLTPEQADKFFPRFKAHRKNMEKIEEEIFTVSHDIRKKIDNEKQITETEFKAIFGKVNKLERQKVDEKERFIAELEKILTINQRAKLALFKQYFIRDIQKQIKKRTQEGT